MWLKIVDCEQRGEGGVKGDIRHYISYMDRSVYGQEEDELCFSWNGKPLGFLLRGVTGSD